MRIATPGTAPTVDGEAEAGTQGTTRVTAMVAPLTSAFCASSTSTRKVFLPRTSGRLNDQLASPDLWGVRAAPFRRNFSTSSGAWPSIVALVSEVEKSAPPLVVITIVAGGSCERMKLRRA